MNGRDCGGFSCQRARGLAVPPAGDMSLFRGEEHNRLSVYSFQDIVKVWIFFFLNLYFFSSFF